MYINLKAPLILCLLIGTVLYACNNVKEQRIDEIRNEIEKVMNAQEVSWNKADMEAYMQGYWQSDSLKFLSNHNITYGWKQQLARYKEGYPDKSVMGILKFEMKHIEKLGGNCVLVIGTYTLKREPNNDAFGYYSLIWKKINQQWVIVFDHTS